MCLGRISVLFLVVADICDVLRTNADSSMGFEETLKKLCSMHCCLSVIVLNLSAIEEGGT